MLQDEPGKKGQKIGDRPFFHPVLVLPEVLDFGTGSGQVAADQKKQGHLQGLYDIIKVGIGHMIVYLYMSRHYQQNGDSFQTVQRFVSFFHGPPHFCKHSNTGFDQGQGVCYTYRHV